VINSLQCSLAKASLSASAQPPPVIYRTSLWDRSDLRRLRRNEDAAFYLEDGSHFIRRFHKSTFSNPPPLPRLFIRPEASIQGQVVHVDKISGIDIKPLSPDTGTDDTSDRVSDGRRFRVWKLLSPLDQLQVVNHDHDYFCGSAVLAPTSTEELQQVGYHSSFVTGEWMQPQWEEVGSFHLRCGYFARSNHRDIDWCTGHWIALLWEFIGFCDHSSDAVEAHLICQYIEAMGFPPLEDIPEIAPRSLLLLHRYCLCSLDHEEELTPDDITIINEVRSALRDAIDDSLQRAIENMRQSTKVTSRSPWLASTVSTALPQSGSTAQSDGDQASESHLSAYK
jgi:hypothetical protein